MLSNHRLVIRAAPHASCLLAAVASAALASAAPADAAPARVALAAPVQAAPSVERLVIYKSEHTLLVVVDGRVYRSYRVALGKAPHGGKLCRGDNRTPEGAYFVARRMPQSRFHLALSLSYPSPTDVQRARDYGCDPGGDIEIHGLTRASEWIGAYHAERDWTNGCIALTNEEITELYRMVSVGTPVEIYP
jgi:murein L,D-transpeptidase YafK